MDNKINCAIMHKVEGIYFLNSWNDEYLLMLVDVFDDNGSWINWLKRELLDLNSRGISGNKAHIIIKGNNIIIEPQFEENPEEYAITISRQVLLQLISTWQDLANKNAKEIIFIRHDDGLITMSGKFESEK